MKKTLKYFVMASCVMLSNFGLAQESDVGEILKGQHALQSVMVLSSYKARTRIVMTWEMCSNRYAVTTIPIDKVQLEFNQDVASPFIRFCWSRGSRCRRSMQEIVDENVLYVLVVCKIDFWNDIVTSGSATTTIFNVKAEAND